MVGLVIKDRHVDPFGHTLAEGHEEAGHVVVWTATLVDTKRLLTLAATNPQREHALRQALTACTRALRTLLAVLQGGIMPAPALSLLIKSATSWLALHMTS
jgi:hypothetical protein